MKKHLYEDLSLEADFYRIHMQDCLNAKQPPTIPEALNLLWWVRTLYGGLAIHYSELNRAYLLIRKKWWTSCPDVSRLASTLLLMDDETLNTLAEEWMTIWWTHGPARHPIPSGPPGTP